MMDLSNVNYIAVIVATFGSFVFGALWYSPILFANSWMEENGFKEEDLKGGNMAAIFGSTFVAKLTMALALEALTIGVIGISDMVVQGAIIGFVFVTLSFGVNYMFERKSIKLFLINGTYHGLML